MKLEAKQITAALGLSGIIAVAAVLATKHPADRVKHITGRKKSSLSDNDNDRWIKHLINSGHIKMNKQGRYVNTGKYKGGVNNTSGYYWTNAAVNKLLRKVNKSSSGLSDSNSKDRKRELLEELDFVFDQLVNAWEFQPPRELYEHLSKETKRINHQGLKKFVNAWYDNDKRRNKILLTMEPWEDKKLLFEWASELGLNKVHRDKEEFRGGQLFDKYKSTKNKNYRQFTHGAAKIRYNPYWKTWQVKYKDGYPIDEAKTRKEAIEIAENASWGYSKHGNKYIKTSKKARYKGNLKDMYIDSSGKLVKGKVPEKKKTIWPKDQHLLIYEEMGEKIPEDTQIEATSSHFGNHYYIHTKLELKGQGIKKTGDGSDHKRGLKSYRVTDNAYNRLVKKYKVVYRGLL